MFSTLSSIASIGEALIESDVLLDEAEVPRKETYLQTVALPNDTVAFDDFGRLRDESLQTLPDLSAPLLAAHA